MAFQLQIVHKYPNLGYLTCHYTYWQLAYFCNHPLPDMKQTGDEDELLITGWKYRCWISANGMLGG